MELFALPGMGTPGLHPEAMTGDGERLVAGDYPMVPTQEQPEETTWAHPPADWMDGIREATSIFNKQYLQGCKSTLKM